MAERLRIQGDGLGIGAAVHEGRQQQEPLRALVAQQVQVMEGDRPALLDDGAGRAPERCVIQSASSSALDTVADRQTRSTPGGAWMITSSHTGPR